MLAASLAADVPLFIASPTSDWASAGRVVRAVAGHRHEVAVRLLLADEGDLRLGRGLGDEVVDAGLAGDGRRRPGVVAGDHHRPDAHLAELGEALDEAFLDRVLELDQAQDAVVVRSASGVAPASAMRSVSATTSGGTAPSSSAAIASTAPLRIVAPSVEPDAARPGLGPERDLLGDRRGESREAGVVAGRRPAAPSSARRSRARSTIERPSGVSSRIEETSAAVRTRPRSRRARRDRRREPVAVGDRAGLVEQDDVDVAGRLDRPAAHRQHVEARDAVHAGDADGGQQAADRRRDEAHEEGDQGDGLDRRPGVRRRTAAASRWPGGT